MNPQRVADRLGRDSADYRRYRRAVLDRLDGDRELRRARTTWAGLVPAGAGTAGAGDVAGARRDAFVAALYHDYVLCRLLAGVEADLGVRLANPEPGSNSGALPVAFGGLHGRVAADAGLPAPGSAADRERDDLPDIADLRDGGVALLSALSTGLAARADRRARGAFYTPRGVADLAVEASGADPAADSFLDPACGAGVFLAAAIARTLDAIDGADPEAAVDGASPESALRKVTDAVVGIDLDPVAVRAARLAYLLALAPVLDGLERDSVAVPVFLTDALGLTREDDLRFRGGPVDLSTDVFVGNPPWLTWSDLPAATRAAWRDRYGHLDLAPASGARARLGHANDDLAVPFVLACVHRYLRPGGRVGVVLKRGLTKGPAGRAFRRLRVGDRRLAVARVHDLGALDPFDAAADAAVYALESGADPAFPVPTTVWEAGGGRDGDGRADDGWADDGQTDDGGGDDGRVDVRSLSALRRTATASETSLSPVDPGDPASSWVRADAERAALGECAHTVRHGVKDDAAAVFGLDRGDLADLEPDLVYPYLKSRHVRRWGITGHDLRLVPQRRAGEDNEATLRERLPRTYAYLDAHRERLEARSSAWLDAGPFYSVFGLGPYTWAPYRVVWCRLGFEPAFAVVSTVEDPDLGEKPVVPGDHYMFVATDDRREAHFLCALLNAAPYRRTLRDVAGGGKASLSKSVVSRLHLPDWPGTERAERLADLSRSAHELVEAAGSDGDVEGDEGGDDGGPSPELAAIEGEVDRLVEALLAG